MSKKTPFKGRIISSNIIEMDYSKIVPKFLTIEESIENIKNSFRFEEDKTLMNKIVKDFLDSTKNE